MLQLSKQELREAYQKMCTIREFEEHVSVEFANGEIPGFVHLYAGEEASGIGVCQHLNEDIDYIASTHRGHGHCIAKGCDVEAMLLARDSIVGISIPSSISLLASLFTRSVICHLATNSLVMVLARLL
jgi:TPP-dependent pyruvate/acetoin dehydrogenase alpha subunit